VEKINQLTHALGLVLSVVGSVVLMVLAAQQEDPWRLAGCFIYAGALMALYAASTLSHSFVDPRRRHFFRIVDQVCIFLLIAGTYTPFMMAFLRESWTFLLLPTVWILAALGIGFKVLVKGHENVSTFAYVLMGWLPVIGAGPICECMPAGALYWILAGGVLYTLGTLFLTFDGRVPYFHPIWHLFVIAASMCHFYAVMTYVIA
jgi:hemolysin III